MELPPFALERYFARHEFTVPISLCSSDCETVTVAELLALEPAAGDRLAALGLGYTEYLGSAALREAIASLYTTASPAQVLVCSGAEEAIFLFMHALLRPGDHVIVHAPCYQSLAALPRAMGCEVTRWEAREAAGWAPDLDELAAAIRPSTRVIVVNTPHNPTGWLMSAAEQRALVELVERHGLVLFSDEVYRESEHDAADRLPAACDLSARAVSLGVLSKTYGLPGLRSGWVATRDPSVLAAMGALKDYTTICNAAPSELLAEVALRHRDSLAGRNLALIRDNLAHLDAFFARHADRFAWRRPRAGPIAFPRLVAGDVEGFCAALASAAGVLLLPGTVFGDAEGHFRVGFGRRNVPEALARFEAFLEGRR